MSQFSKDNASHLIELLGKELELFTRVRELTVQQKELIAADDIVALDFSLDRRQEIIGEINGLHQETNVLMQSYMLFSTGGKSISEIEAAAGKLRDIIVECAELNENNLSDAKGVAEGYISKIGELSLNRKGLGAYIQTVENRPEMFDKMT